MKRYAFTNQSDRIQVIKTMLRHWERTLFPGQEVTFEADPEDFLEIYTYQNSTSLLDDRTPCSQLQDLFGGSEERSALLPSLESRRDLSRSL